MEQFEISICVLTYYHEKYIAETINSIMAQKISVPYEIVISDDCSKDSTIQIIEDYQARYPGLIRLLKAEENQGIPRNLYKLITSAKGKYISLLDGDDYYIDENKTIEQYSLLSQYSDKQIIAVSSLIKYMKKDKEVLLPRKKFHNKSFSLKDYLAGYDFPTNGLMFRNIFTSEEGKALLYKMVECSNSIDDLSFCMLVLMVGDVYVLPIQGVFYRSRNSSDERNYRSINTQFSSLKKHVDLLNSFHGFFPEIDLSSRYYKVCAKNYIKSLLSGKTKDFNTIYYTIPPNYRRNMKLRILLFFFFKKLKGVV